jgi:hypothetical protein
MALKMPSEQEMNTILNTYGINSSSFNFSWPQLIGGFIFGIVGLYAFNYGRKEKNYKVLSIGLVLMVYPYFVSNTILVYAIGLGVSSLLYFWRD